MLEIQIQTPDSRENCIPCIPTMGCSCVKCELRQGIRVGQTPEKELCLVITYEQVADIRNVWKKVKSHIAGIGTIAFLW